MLQNNVFLYIVNTTPTVISTPLVSNIKPYTASILPTPNPTLSKLGPGTIIMPNGSVIPVIPQNQNIIASTPAIVTNKAKPPVNISNLIVVTNITTAQVNSRTITTFSMNQQSQARTTQFRTVKPKICLTNTTHVNKVPIPASRYAGNYIILDKPEPKSKPKILNKSSKINKGKTKKKDVSFEVEISDNKRKNNDEENNPAKKSKTESTEGGTSESQEATDNLTKETELAKDTSQNELPKVNDSGETQTVKQIPMEETVHHTPEIIETTVEDLDLRCDVTAGTEHIVANNEQSEIIKPCDPPIDPVPVPSKGNESDLEHHLASITDDKLENTEPCKDKNTDDLNIPEITDNTDHEMKTLEMNLPPSELSNDIFASLQVPSGCQNPESTSPTAAFLNTFPLVSTFSGVKVTEVIDEDNSESQRGTPNLLQIGTMVNTKPTATHSDTLTPSLMNLDNFSFFTGKDFSTNFCNSFTTVCSSTVVSSTNTMVTSSVITTVSSSYAIGTLTDTKKIAQIPDNSATIISEKNYASKTKLSSELVPSLYNHTNQLVGNKIVSSSNSLNTQHTYNLPGSNKGHDVTPPKKHDNKQQYIQQKPYVNSNVNFPIISDTSTKVNTPCSYSNISKNYNNTFNSNNSYSYNYHTDTNLNQNYYRNISKNDNRSYYPLTHYDNYSDCRKTDASFTNNYYPSQNTSKEVSNKNKQPVQTRPPVNWMTTPDNRVQNSTTDYLLPSFTKESDFSHNNVYPTNTFVSNTQTSYFNTNTLYNTSDICGNVNDNRKTLDLPLHPPINNFQRTDVEEWSPTKMPQFLDPLVGDLGLTNHIFDQKNETKCSKERHKDSRRTKTNNFDNQTNFLSVSQLVDNNKSDNVPARTTARRNSGSRCKPQQSKQKRKSQETKDVTSFNMKSDLKSHTKPVVGNYNSNELYCENKPTKVTSSSYSAEALIGHNNHNIQADKKQNYNANKTLPVPSFLTDNILPYFTPVEFTQDNNYMQQNQNYTSNTFSHSFSTFQNNTYTANSFMPSASTISSSYIPTNNFVHDTTHDFISDNFNLFTKEKHTGKNTNRQTTGNNREDKNNHNSGCSNNYKKSKKKANNDGSLPGFDIQFLSMPGNRNSPILPDDFHTHTSFLPPATSYKNMTPLYNKNPDITSSTLLPLVPGSRSGNQPEISPSTNVAAGTSLTNFNLSTIFPEINKGTIPDLYRDSRSKDQSSSRNYNTPTSSIQVRKIIFVTVVIYC